MAIPYFRRRFKNIGELTDLQFAVLTMAAKLPRGKWSRMMDVLPMTEGLASGGYVNNLLNKFVISGLAEKRNNGYYGKRGFRLTDKAFAWIEEERQPKPKPAAGLLPPAYTATKVEVRRWDDVSQKLVPVMPSIPDMVMALIEAGYTVTKPLPDWSKQALDATPRASQ